MSKCDRIAAFPGDLAFGARPHRFASFGNDSIWRVIDRTIACRYNAEGAEPLGDLRRRNGASATNLKPDLLATLRDRLRKPPPDGGLWSSRKAWQANTSVAAQRGWEALKAIGWSIQKPRPKNPKSVSPAEAAAFKKSLRTPLSRRPQNPEKADRVLRHGRASHRPEAGYAACLGAHRQASDRTWPSSFRLALRYGLRIPGDRRDLLVSFKRRIEGIFAALLETFARETEAGMSRIILLVLDNAGWHGPANLKFPDGIRLIHLPPYSSELQPAETLRPVVDEPIVNKRIATIEELDTKIANQCVALVEQIIPN